MSCCVTCGVTAIIRQGGADLGALADALRAHKSVKRIIALASPDTSCDGVDLIHTSEPDGWDALKQAIDSVDTKFVMFVEGDALIQFGPRAIERLVKMIRDTGAGIVYADHRTEKQGKIENSSVTDYQLGSIRDNFRFGPLLLATNEAIQKAVSSHGFDLSIKVSAQYDLRLKISIDHAIIRLPEPLYTVRPLAAGEGHFAYLDPANQAFQLEREVVATEHLKRIGAHLPPTFEPVPEPTETFPVQASVIIPVRNREKTIAEAVRSAANQKTSFDHNVIVVDNHSTDRTTDILRELCAELPNLVHLVPTREDLGIGGCWNEAVACEHCGRYAVQLDSDDLYIDENSVEKIVTELMSGPYAMLVGAYTIVDFKLNEIPPGLIDHREWTRDNGRNNALRVNGLGAPRAFDASLLRKHPLPNVSYGEDYALGLRFTRQYELGRLYDSLYLCRRWEDNTDAALPIAKVNEYDTYKDRLRTIELLARQQMNR